MDYLRRVGRSVRSGVKQTANMGFKRARRIAEDGYRGARRAAADGLRGAAMGVLDTVQGGDFNLRNMARGAYEGVQAAAIPHLDRGLQRLDQEYDYVRGAGQEVMGMIGQGVLDSSTNQIRSFGNTVGDVLRGGKTRIRDRENRIRGQLVNFRRLMLQRQEAIRTHQMRQKERRMAALERKNLPITGPVMDNTAEATAMQGGVGGSGTTNEGMAFGVGAPATQVQQQPPITAAVY